MQVLSLQHNCAYKTGTSFRNYSSVVLCDAAVDDGDDGLPLPVVAVIGGFPGTMKRRW